MARTVGEVMSRGVKTLREDQFLLEAMQFLRREGVRHIPIMSGEALVGILTDRDVKRATPSGLDPGQRDVWEKLVSGTRLTRVMTRDPTVASPELPLAEAVGLFVDEGIGCLPILEGERLVGIVTARDLLRAFHALLEPPAA